MEIKQLGDFGRSTKPSQKYYSKPLLRRWFSFHALLMSFIVLGNEIFNPCILKSYELGGFFTLLIELIALTLAWSYIDVILFTLEITPEGISQFNRRLSFIKWEEFKSIKVKKILGSRILSVQGVKKQSPVLIFTKTPHEKQQLLQYWTVRSSPEIKKEHSSTIKARNVRK
jgi:hypothetical protein